MLRAKAKAAALAARGERDAVAGRRCGGLVRAVNDLTELLNATRQIVAQTRQRVAGDHFGRGGVDGSACTTVMPAPITKGRLGKPVEFEHKAQVVNDLTELLNATRQIVAQTRQRVAGDHFGRGGVDSLRGDDGTAPGVDSGWPELSDPAAMMNSCPRPRRLAQR